MTALMVNKPDDHISYIRECLDKVQHNPQRLRWDFFVSASSNNAKNTSLTRPTLVKTRQKGLPPVRPSNSLPRANQKSDYRTVNKSLALPPIENSRKPTDNQLPIVFILSINIFLCQNLNILLFSSFRFRQFDKSLLEINRTLQSNRVFIHQRYS